MEQSRTDTNKDGKRRTRDERDCIMYAADACCVCTFLRLPGSRAGGSCSDGRESG